MFVVALLLSGAQATGPFDPYKSEELAKQHCSAKWPDDFEMQEYCVKQQSQGMHDFAEALRAAPPALTGTLYNWELYT